MIPSTNSAQSCVQLEDKMFSTCWIFAGMKMTNNGIVIDITKPVRDERKAFNLLMNQSTEVVMDCMWISIPFRLDRVTND